MDKRIYFFIGTAAELIKIAPVMREFRRKKISFKLITSGQNRINLEDFADYVGKLKPIIAFKQKKIKSSAFYFILWALKLFFLGLIRLRREFKGANRKSIYFIVHGDTVSALLGAIIARLYGLKLLHIESGYRSFNFFEPFPEEICRFLIAFLADVCFYPNIQAYNNIKNFRGIKINTHVNTAYENFMRVLNLKVNSKPLISLGRSKYFLLILHRQEHMIFQKELTKEYFNTMTLSARPDLKCILILHMITENFLNEQGLMSGIEKNPNVIVVPKLQYAEFVKVLAGSEFIATDSGGNQQEAYFLGKPCLILRKSVEGAEGVGENAVIAGENIEVIKNFVENYKTRRRKKITIKKLPSEIITDYIEKLNYTICE